MVATGGPKSPGARWGCPGGLGSGVEGAPTGLELGAAQVGEVGAPLALVEFCAPSGLVGFEDSCTVFSAL
jgi:hypothetical protein